MKIWEYKPGTMGPHSGMARRSLVKATHCDNCGVVVVRPPSQCKGKTVSCSRSCADELKKVRVKVNCSICAKEFELIPAKVGMIVTCSKACQKLRRAYDVIKNAPRFGEEKLTRTQFLSQKGITGNEFNYRKRKGVALDAPRARERPVIDPESGKLWASISACAADLGVSASAVSGAIKRNGRCLGVLVRFKDPIGFRSMS